MNNKEIEELMAKQLSGELTPEENLTFRQWLNCNQNNREEFNKMALSYQLSKGRVVNSQKSKVLLKIRRRIEIDNDHLIAREQYINHIRMKVLVSIAASILILISVGMFYYTNSVPSEFLETNQIETVVKTNPAGQKSKVFLPDGSIVWLNSESSITYQPEFNDSCRQIYLTGEAYFEVKKDQYRPFIVSSGTITTTALGTAFNVNAFNENRITVSLTQGKVNVETSIAAGEKRALIINAGEGVFYNSESENEINKILIDPKKVLMWRNGLLHLENASLTETITRLERWYGVKIILKNQPKEKWNANGLFDNEYLDNVLQSLSFSQEFDYSIEGKKVFVSFK